MPIGKNAIKRVENNGYSKVKTSAPDMENSHVIVSPDPQVADKPVAPAEKAVKKPVKAKKQKTTEKTTKKSGQGGSSRKAVSSKKAANKAVKTDGFVRVEVGNEMPFYLL